MKREGRNIAGEVGAVLVGREGVGEVGNAVGGVFGWWKWKGKRCRGRRYVVVVDWAGTLNKYEYANYK